MGRNYGYRKAEGDRFTTTETPEPLPPVVTVGRADIDTAEGEPEGIPPTQGPVRIPKFATPDEPSIADFTPFTSPEPTAAEQDPAPEPENIPTMKDFDVPLGDPEMPSPQEDDVDPNLEVQEPEYVITDS